MNMNDLNLIPQQIRIEEEKKFKRKIYIILSVIISFVFVLITLIPVYLTYKINNENKQIQQEILKLNHISEEINRLNQQKKEVQERSKIIDSLLKQEIRWTNTISDISSLMPTNVTIISFNGSTENISLHCTAQSRDDIAVFMGKLESSGKFIDIRINEIKADEKTSNYLFDMQINMKNTESKVK